MCAKIYINNSGLQKWEFEFCFKKKKSLKVSAVVEFDAQEVSMGAQCECNFPLWLTCCVPAVLAVFECAYAQLVLPWYAVPESCEQQPLHQVLSREFDFVIDRIIERAKDFDVSHAVVGSIRILTQHLHNAKQSDRWSFTLSFI